MRPAGHREAGRTTPSREEPDPVTAASRRILIVEDDQELASVMRRYLTGEGFTVDVASDGEWAVGMLSIVDCPFDAVVLDLMLPGVSGREVCRRLRAAGRWLPIMMVTALGDTRDHVQGFEDGADDYLPKPFSLQELVMRLRAVLRRSGGSGGSGTGGTAATAVLEVGDLRLDLLRRRCWRAGTELALAPREFEVLEYFMRRPGLVISRRSVLAAVWGTGAAVAPNTVDQYMALLRRKIDTPFGRSDLETLPRVGYRLRAPWPD